MDREGFHDSPLCLWIGDDFHDSKSELLYIWLDNLGIGKYLIGVRFYSSILSRLSVNMPFESQEKWGQRCGTVGV